MQASEPRAPDGPGAAVAAPGGCASAACAHHVPELTALRCAALFCRSWFGTREILGRSEAAPVARAAELFLGWLHAADSVRDCCLRQDALLEACERRSPGHGHEEVLRAAKVLYGWMIRERRLPEPASRGRRAEGGTR
jgi:hypothetical protein